MPKHHFLLIINNTENPCTIHRHLNETRNNSPDRALYHVYYTRYPTDQYYPIDRESPVTAAYAETVVIC